MQRNAISAACVLALSMYTAKAKALDLSPYLEYEVTEAGFPTLFYRDVKAAAVEVAARRCQRNGYTDCVVTKIDYVNSLYFVYYSYKNEKGNVGSGFEYNYHLYGCDLPTRLYLVSGTTRYGPYPNRTIAPGPSWGEPVCHSDTGPQPDPDPDPEHRQEHQSDMGPGDCKTRPSVGNPINIALGNKYQEIVDIPSTLGSPLTWSRYYNSGIVSDDPTPMQTVTETARMGARWRGTYDRSIAVITTNEGSTARLHRHTGERIDFMEVGGRYRSVVDPRGQLSRGGEGWTYRSSNGEVEEYDTKGRLVSIDVGTERQVRLRYGDALTDVTDLQGRKLSITYDRVGRVESVSGGAGVAVTYTYSENDEAGIKADLAFATYSDGSTHEYLYNESVFNGGVSHPHVLTGIYDESRQRFATFWYDKDGRAIRSEHAAGAEGVELTRENDGTVAVTGPNNAVHRYHFADVRGSRRLLGVDQPGGSGCGAAYSKMEYDDNGLVSQRTDFDGRVTEYGYDVNGNEVDRIEAPGTPLARRTMTEWHAVFNKLTHITSPGREERFSYDALGRIVGRELRGAIDPAQPGDPLTLWREWRMTYDSDGHLLNEEGPRSDTGKPGTNRRFTYRTNDAPDCTASDACAYRKGDLWKTENALGQADEILAYDAAGRIVSRRDIQGSTFTYSYTKRGWLTEVSETRPGGAIAVTTLTYTARGDIASVTDPDGVTVRFEYDRAGRLASVLNPSNHRYRFERDAAGRITGEQAYDMFSLKTQVKRVYDVLGRIESETNGEGESTRYVYDELGRLTGVTDASGRRDAASYDALGRLREWISDIDGRLATTRTSYDPIDQLSSIEDAKGVTTRYLVTGLGDIAGIDSPDGGESIDEHDATGLVAKHEGAGGIGSYRVTRDALGRSLSINYADTSFDKRFDYDLNDPLCTSGERHTMGRLSAMSQATSRTVYCYDAPGNVTRKVQRLSTSSKAVAYAYSPAGRVTSVTVDGGARATYRYDIDGSVVGIVIHPAKGAPVDLITTVAYQPFDLIESWRYGNGRELTASRDKAGRVKSWGGVDPGNSIYLIGYTRGGQVASLTARAYGYNLGYDGLGYLSSIADTRNSSTREFVYDRTGDRESETAGASRSSYIYDLYSHRLNVANGKQRRYDAAGNTIAVGDATLAYDAVGRLASASERGHLLVSYGYDADDTRIARTEAAGSGTLLMLHDEEGRWLADYDLSGKVMRQAVWLNDYLVGVVDGDKVFYVEPDHLGTPRAVIDPDRQVAVWRWRPSDEPFGSTPPDEDPDGDGLRFVFDLRLPGQRLDPLTGLHANGRRDYDPETGRYVQADPIGLNGGLNPYLYVYGNPLSYTDPEGMAPPGRVGSAHSWKQPPGPGGIYGQGVKRLTPRPDIVVNETAGAWPSGTGRTIDDPRYELVCTRASCVTNVMSCDMTSKIWQSVDSYDPAQAIMFTRDVPSNCRCHSIEFLDHVLEERRRGAVSMPDGNAFDAIDVADKLLRIRPFRGGRK